MTPQELGPSYACHYLQVGALRCAMVHIRPIALGQYKLSPFSSESERTIFVEGTLHLVCSQCPTSLAPDEANLDQLQALLDQHADWQILNLPR